MKFLFFSKGFFLSVFFLAVFLLLYPPGLSAQSTRTDQPYLVPQTIFVGDPGRLVVPLGRTLAGISPFVIENPEKLPDTPELRVKRLELERRGGSSRLLIDFIPYAPGLLYLPALEILAPGEDTEALVVTGLEVQVASILSPTQMSLSEPASPLAVPGTSFLIYGTMLVLLLFLCLGIGVTLWGRRNFRELLERYHRRRLIRAMTKFLRCLRQECGFEKEGNEGYYLSLLSGEFREFLSLFTGINCRSLTPGEFLELPLSQKALALGPVYLCWLFRNWDTLRFSGKGMEMADIFEALSEIERLIIALDREEKEKSFPGKAFSGNDLSGVLNMPEPGSGNRYLGGSL